MVIYCRTCGGSLQPDVQNMGEEWKCRWCPTIICDHCYWRHTAEKHPEKP